ncbi:hypothetical protein BB560_002571 [Smittium megazygosporum]|uniref:Uncharacterized protein n=1 Tax=Smittium megazygosporum TaxID=133381 RepID=A0A2T9ZEF8_9FUNG|nr:hypothetical protein BB560_002571 [Smittium megazygosporum]
MTDLTRCVVNSKYKTPEEGKVLSDDISKVTAESVSSYFIDEPRYPPAGRLKRKSPPDLMCATFGAMRHTNTLKTNEGFGVAKIGNGMRIIRYIEIELADCPGKHKTEYWKGDHPSLYRWPHPFLDELMTQDAERIEQKKPRNPYSEIVVHNEENQMMTNSKRNFSSHEFSALCEDFAGSAPIIIQGGRSEVLVKGIDALAKHVGSKEVQIGGSQHLGFQTKENNRY